MYSSGQEVSNHVDLKLGEGMNLRRGQGATQHWDPLATSTSNTSLTAMPIQNGRRRETTTEERIKIIEGHAEGWNQWQIAEHLGVSQTCVHRVLKVGTCIFSFYSGNLFMWDMIDMT